MAVTRRQFLDWSRSCGRGNGGVDGLWLRIPAVAARAAATNMAFAWWGNAVRNENTSKAIAAYTAANPG